MKVQFANGLIFDVTSIDEAIAKCLESGNDPFNPLEITSESKQDTTPIKEVVQEDEN